MRTAKNVKYNLFNHLYITTKVELIITIKVIINKINKKYYFFFLSHLQTSQLCVSQNIAEKINTTTAK